MPPAVPALAAALVLATAHVAGGRIRGLDVVPRNALLSAGSGVSVAYVFVHLLPELAAVQEHIAELVGGGVLPYLERHAWLMALVGLLVFYGLDLMARRSSRRGGDDRPDADLVGWLHVASYGLYNGIVGYLLLERAHEATTTLALFAIAMGLHMLVNDHGLRADHGALYHRAGRWIVGAAVIGGWALAVATEITEAGLGLLLAFLAGGVVMNVLKEELPEGRQSRWVPMALGAAGYTGLLLLL